MNTAEILKKFRRVAVVGMSPNEARPSYYVSEYLQQHGYSIVGVNPGQTEILGVPVYPTLSEVPPPIEIVAVFRASEYLAEVVDAAIAAKARALWIQLGIEDSEAEARAERAGLIVVRRKCMMVEHQNLR